MNSALTPYIEQLLFTNDTVVIPGLGAFVTKPNSSTIDYAGGSITPPSKSLTFNENLTTDDGLLTYAIVNDRQISDDEAKMWIEEKVAEINHLLAQREIVALPGIGRLYKNYVQKIQFLPDAANFSRENFGLPPIQFSPLSRSREVSDSAPETVSNTVSSSAATPPQPLQFEVAKSGSLNWKKVFWAIALLALSGTIGYVFLQRQKKAYDQSKISVNAPEEEPVEKEEIVNLPAAAPQTDGSSEKITPKENTTPPTTKPVVSKECIALIGLFKDPGNIDRLKRKLESNGFAIYALPGKNGGETVGVKFLYRSDEELKANLDKVRKVSGEKNIVIKKK